MTEPDKILTDEEKAALIRKRANEFAAKLEASGLNYRAAVLLWETEKALLKATGEWSE
jgi:hypothetical protein